jgi:uncharacterized membrane protein YgcG
MPRVPPSNRALLALSFLFVACAGPDLRKEKVVFVEPRVDAASFCPGQRADLVVRVKLEDGKEYVTEGKARGNIDWSNFEVSSDKIEVGRKGAFFFPEDPRAYSEGYPLIRLQTAGHPDRNTQVEVPIRFDCDYVADFSGRDGRDGPDGPDGEEATQEHGATRGQDGTSGTPGTSADSVQLWVGLIRAADGVAFLQARARGVNSGVEHLYWVDTRGGRLTVLARGGSGGNGGNGGKPAKGTAAGGGGNGGDAGSGGDVQVVMSPEAAEFAKLVRYETAAGKAGTAGENRVGHGVIDVLAAVLLTPQDGKPGKAGTVNLAQEPVPALW